MGDKCPCRGLFRYFAVPITVQCKLEGVYVADVFGDTSEEFLRGVSSSGLTVIGLCSPLPGEKMGIKRVRPTHVGDKQETSSLRVIVPYNYQYVKQVRALAESGVVSCEVAVQVGSRLVMIDVGKDLMRKIKNKEYNRTITFNKFNASDSNVHALLKNVPDRYREKYAINVIHGKDVWKLENIVTVPLSSSVTVSGFATFLYHYPKLTYNIEVGHGGLQLKACGLMDKSDKNSGGNPAVFEKVDLVCVASHLNMIVFSSFYGLPENRFCPKLRRN